MGSFGCRAASEIRVNMLGVLSLSFQLQKMKEKKGLYPDKSVYTQQIGPGFCFGALALMLRFFFEVPVCTLNHPDLTRCKGHYQDRRTPTSHHWAASSLGQNPAQVWVSGVGVLGSGGRDEGPFLIVPIPAPGPLTAVWAGTDVTASDTQGDARSLFPPLSESKGHGPCFLQPYVVLKIALSHASGVFWKLGMGDLRTPLRATAGTGYDPGTARSKAGSCQRKDSQLTPRGTRSRVYNLLLLPLASLPVLCKRVRLSRAGKAITPRHSCRSRLCSALPLQLLCALGAARYNLTVIPKDYFSKHLVIANSSRT